MQLVFEDGSSYNFYDADIKSICSDFFYADSVIRTRTESNSVDIRPITKYSLILITGWLPCKLQSRP